jgi:prevent-host-death family protein
MKTMARRALRDRMSHVLRRAEAGERMRITVDGCPVADLTPIGDVRRTFVPQDELLGLFGRAPLDRRFSQDIASATRRE